LRKQESRGNDGIFYLFCHSCGNRNPEGMTAFFTYFVIPVETGHLSDSPRRESRKNGFPLNRLRE
ncbi:MAG: hypothetical protein WA126_01765, partial [Thermodesulfovibrionales bacterium]